MKTDKVILVLNMMYDECFESEYASPNVVAKFATDEGIILSSDEVVMISNYYGESNCPTGRNEEL